MSTTFKPNYSLRKYIKIIKMYF